MSDTVFCYHCRRQHARADVVQVETRGVKRWRCRQSIVLCRRSVGERDAFGKAVSDLNRRACEAVAQKPLPHAVIELMFAAAPAERGAA